MDMIKIIIITISIQSFTQHYNYYLLFIFYYILECYEKSWKLEFEASAAAGFKLAFCYLKCRKFVEAIDVCETVLDQYPEYPRIREEILKKAVLGIRSQAA